ncbi:metal ABC transporter substrate-binding protein [Labedella endophytica]|uniref:Metal ABC transporter substrate-binding protein n=1 Tax=Labedella endophytica TaxID=1523160 RepID=A0A433JW76_9MICO|nr:zinc ABC transporter substrate-binding protein [Labedella endophytica]RUR03223.1 metal ABC transporter substrate-binding protein [Labedella endophytica]
MTRRLPAFLLAVPVTALVLAGCASGGTAGSTDDADTGGGGLTVVASTNVYGDIAQTIGGDAVDVTSIIDSAAQDPHSYEATAQDQLTISNASLVIENGGGYDPFIDTLVDAAGADDLVVLNASELSGLMPDDEHADEDHAEEDHAEEDHADEGGDHEGHDHVEGFNEHVWYSMDAMDALAHEIAHELGELDPENASTFEDNYDAFAAELGTITASAEEIAAAHGGESVTITEPVPLYLLESAGLENVTPGDFSEAIEEGTDVSPAVLAETLGLFESGDVALLAYNDQTSSPETERVREAAEAADVPVVNFTETLPDGDSYIEWMTANLTAISDALA